jgi:hypothetical protein
MARIQKSVIATFLIDSPGVADHFTAARHPPEGDGQGEAVGVCDSLSLPEASIRDSGSTLTFRRRTAQ